MQPTGFGCPASVANQYSRMVDWTLVVGALAVILVIVGVAILWRKTPATQPTEEQRATEPRTSGTIDAGPGGTSGGV